MAGTSQSRVYVYRARDGKLARMAVVDVPSCHGGACLVGDKLIVLGDALYVFTRAGESFGVAAETEVHNASAAVADSNSKRLIGLLHGLKKTRLRTDASDRHRAVSGCA